MSVDLEASKSLVYTVAAAGASGRPFDAALDVYFEARQAAERTQLGEVGTATAWKVGDRVEFTSNFGDGAKLTGAVHPFRDGAVIDSDGDLQITDGRGHTHYRKPEELTRIS